MRTPRPPVASTLHTTSEHGVSSIITADVHTSAAGSQYLSHYLEHGVSSITIADAHTSAAGSQYSSHYLGTWCIQHADEHRSGRVSAT